MDGAGQQARTVRFESFKWIAPTTGERNTGHIWKSVLWSMSMHNQDTLLRLPQVLARIPVSRATWYAGVKAGRFPAPVSLGPRAVAWRLSDIAALMQVGAA